MKIGDEVIYEGYTCIIAFCNNDSFILELSNNRKGWPQRSDSLLNSYKPILSGTFWHVNKDDLTPCKPIINNSYSIF